MEMQGQRELAVTRQQAWNALNDPEVLKACIPGCDRMEASGENQYAIGMAVKVGPVAARFGGKIRLEDVNPPSSYTLHFEGQGGPAGFGKGSAQVALAERPRGCQLTYTAKAQVGGRIAQVGQRLIDGVARSMAEDFFRRLEVELQRQHPEAFDPSQPAAVAAPATGAPGRTAVPAWAWGVGAVVVAALAFWLTR